MYILYSGRYHTSIIYWGILTIYTGTADHLEVLSKSSLHHERRCRSALLKPCPPAAVETTNPSVDILVTFALEALNHFAKI